MKEKKVSSECRACDAFWAHGIKDGKHNKWCCRYGMAAWKAYNHCRNVGKK